MNVRSVLFIILCEITQYWIITYDILVLWRYVIIMSADTMDMRYVVAWLLYVHVYFLFACVYVVDSAVTLLWKEKSLVVWASANWGRMHVANWI